jgi:anti-sigma factor (TIGR02949 family)
MSCGNPHEVDCGEVLARVTVFLEHSLGETGQLGYESIEQHLIECQPCLDQFGGQVEELQRAIRAALERCCRGEHAPDDLRQRVQQRIRVTRVTTT